MSFSLSKLPTKLLAQELFLELDVLFSRVVHERPVVVVVAGVSRPAQAIIWAGISHRRGLYSLPHLAVMLQYRNEQQVDHITAFYKK